MYCPNCGNADQNENAYCRQCGEFIPRLSRSPEFAWGRLTPHVYIRTGLFLNLLIALLSLIVGALLLSNLNSNGDLTFLIVLSGGLLLAIALWQIASFTIGLSLTRHFNKGWVSKNQVSQSVIDSAVTKELLPEPNFDNLGSASVTETTTRKLSEKVRR